MLLRPAGAQQAHPFAGGQELDAQLLETVELGPHRIGWSATTVNGPPLSTVKLDVMTRRAASSTGIHVSTKSTSRGRVEPQDHLEQALPDVVRVAGQ